MLEPDPGRVRRCVVLFARAPRDEARAKGLERAEALFSLLHARIAKAVAALRGTDLLVASQRGRMFAERLAHAFSDARSLGYEHVVVVGADAPALGMSHIASALDALERHDVVLGPAQDGGVYLIGTRRAANELIYGVPWCTSRVLAQLAARAPGAFVLPQCLADVDCTRNLGTLLLDRSVDPELRVLVRAILRCDTPRRIARPFRLLPSWRGRPGASRAPPVAHPTLVSN